MRSQTLHPPATLPAASAARKLAVAWQRLRHWMDRHAARRHLARAERALAEMSLSGLRDIGAPEPLLQRRQRQEELQRLELRAWSHLRG